MSRTAAQKRKIAAALSALEDAAARFAEQPESPAAIAQAQIAAARGNLAAAEALLLAAEGLQ